VATMEILPPPPIRWLSFSCREAFSGDFGRVVGIARGKNEAPLTGEVKRGEDRNVWSP